MTQLPNNNENKNTSDDNNILNSNISSDSDSIVSNPGNTTSDSDDGSLKIADTEEECIELEELPRHLRHQLDADGHHRHIEKVTASGRIKYASHKKKKHSHKHHSSGSGRHSSGSEGYSSKSKKRKKKKSWKKKLLVVLLALLFVIVVAVVTFSLLNYFGKQKYLEANKEVSVDVIDDADSEDNGKTIYYKNHRYSYNENIATIVFIGVDRSKLGNSEIGNSGQADAIYIFAYDTNTAKCYVIPVSRDSMTDIELFSASGQSVGFEKKQLCLSYAYGDGKKTSCQNTLDALSRMFYNIPFETYVALNWDGIAPLNDMAGGVSLTCIEDIQTTTFNVKKGDELKLIGQDAWSYVQYRNIALLNSNQLRLARQKQYLTSYLSKIIPMAKQDLTFVKDLYDTANKYMYRNLTLTQTIYTASTILPKTYSHKDIEFVTIDGEIKAGQVSAEFYPDETSLFEAILKVFYNRVQ